MVVALTLECAIHTRVFCNVINVLCLHSCSSTTSDVDRNVEINYCFLVSSGSTTLLSQSHLAKHLHTFLLFMLLLRNIATCPNMHRVTCVLVKVFFFARHKQKKCPTLCMQNTVYKVWKQWRDSQR